jgi:hypothetical protein
MKKLFIVTCMALLLLGLASHSFADELTLKAEKAGEWTINNSAGQPVGKLRSTDDGGYSVQLGSGPYIGAIRKTGELQINQRHAVLTPEQAQFYLDVLDAIKSLK